MIFPGSKVVFIFVFKKQRILSCCMLNFIIIQPVVKLLRKHSREAAILFTWINGDHIVELPSKSNTH